MIPKMAIKELEQKYSGCFIRVSSKDSEKITVRINSVSMGDEADVGYLSVTSVKGTHKIPIPSDEYTLYLSQPKGGLVNLESSYDPYFIVRTADKQYSRGFVAGNYSVLSLPLLVLGDYLHNNRDVSCNMHEQNKKAYAKEWLYTVPTVSRMYNKMFDSLDIAIESHRLGRALTSKFAIVRSINPDYLWEVYRETTKIGHIEGKTIVCHPLYEQEVSDYIRRTRQSDWSVYGKA